MRILSVGIVRASEDSCNNAVFDPQEVRDTNTYEAPKSYAAGVPYVVVNGVVVIDSGEHTGARPGRPVLGPRYQPARTVARQ